MNDKLFLYFENGVPKQLLTLAEVVAMNGQSTGTGSTSVPPKPSPITDVLADLTPIGKRGDTLVYRLNYNGAWVAEMPSTNPKHIVIRGVNALKLPGTTLTGDVSNLSGGNTANNGLDIPAAFPATVPGYTRSQYADKGVYYLLTGNMPQFDVN